MVENVEIKYQTMRRAKPARKKERKSKSQELDLELELELEPSAWFLSLNISSVLLLHRTNSWLMTNVRGREAALEMIPHIQPTSQGQQK